MEGRTVCGVGVAYSLRGEPLDRPEVAMAAMDTLLAHRGPDGNGSWVGDRRNVAFMHRRLAIIDLNGGAQPMRSPESGTTLTFNGLIYNYPELRDELGGRVLDKSDTAVILAGYEAWGEAVVEKLRGMYAFAIFDPARDRLFCARDRLGIKPLYYTVVDDVLYVASEAKALLPFVEQVAIDQEALADFLTFQFVLGDSTLFEGIRRLPPGHTLTADHNGVRVEKYWELQFDIDQDMAPAEADHRVEALLDESIDIHLRADVPVAAYASGGLDSSLVAALATKRVEELQTYHGHFTEGPEFSEQVHGRAVAEHIGVHFNDYRITESDVVRTIEDAVYAMDYPEAGPGLLPQYVLAEQVADRFRVVLGGQGGDEVFGGYTRYQVAYFEQWLSAAIDGTEATQLRSLSSEMIEPRLGSLRGYKPMIRSFFAQGLFGPSDTRYFDLIDRSREYADGDVRWGEFSGASPRDRFLELYHAIEGSSQSYFDAMTNFDLHSLLPALLHVEDRVSMAHGLESRVPLLDHRLVEYASTVPAAAKFGGDNTKRLLREVSRRHLPVSVVDRVDKMGFPTPLNAWMSGDFGDFVRDTLGSEAAKGRHYVDNRNVVESLGQSTGFSRKMWAFLTLELWARRFLDRAVEFRGLYRDALPADTRH